MNVHRMLLQASATACNISVFAAAAANAAAAAAAARTAAVPGAP